MGPEPEIVVGTREQLLHLLAEAAEIEHTLMCSYLYAAFSLKWAGEPGVSEAQDEALERWRQAIISVAVRGVEPLLPGEVERRLLVERAVELARVGERVFPPVSGQLTKARDALARL